MALNDLTSQNIQDTYQKVVQTDGTNLSDGTGSLLPISFNGNNVIISGSLIAQTYIVSESIINISSGSTVFGDSSDDTHTFTGNVSASGHISASGKLYSTGLVMAPDSAITPSSNNESIYFRSKLDGTGTAAMEWMEIGDDVIDMRVNGKQRITIDPTNIKFNAQNQDIIYQFNSANTIIHKMLKVGDYNLNFFRDHLAVGSGSGTFPTTDGTQNASPDGTLKVWGNLNVVDGQTPDGIPGHITSSGHISASGNLIGYDITTKRDITVGRTLNAVGNISSSGNLSATGDLDIKGNANFVGPITSSAYSTYESGSGIAFGPKAQSLASKPYINGTFNTSLSGLPSYMTIEGRNFITMNSTQHIVAQVPLFIAFEHLRAGKSISGSSLISQTHITASGNISASGMITAGFGGFNQDGFNIGHYDIDFNQVRLGDEDKPTNFISTTSTTFNAPVTASGNIEAGSYVSASEFRTTGHITASGDISASGDIQFNTLTGIIHGGSF